MQPIHVLGTDFKFRASIKSYISMIFKKSWHGIGSFEFIVHRDTPGVNEIKKDVLIALSPNKVGIVKHREIQLDEKGKETENWLFKGWTLKGLALQRITMPPYNTAYDNKSGNAETVMKHYIERNLVNPTDPKRKIPNLEIASNRNRGNHISWQSRLKTVSDELEEISIATGLGWDIKLDIENRRFVFDVFEGLDKSINQSDRSPVYFSPEFGNIKTQSFTDSDFNLRNVGYVGGQGEGIDRKIIEIGSAEGLNRYETFIDARNIGGEDENGNPLPPEEELKLLTERGQQKLSEMENELFLEAEIMYPITRTTYEEVDTERKKKTKLLGPFVYERDYFLGDLVTIMNRDWGVLVDKRITEVTEIYESGGFKLEVTFGQQRPTIFSKIKDEFKQYEGLLKQ